jgi:type I restriction enzyme M protein
MRQDVDGLRVEDVSELIGGQMPRTTREARSRNGNGANLGFEETLWKTADALRGQVDAAEYKHIVLGLVFLKYVSDAFEEQRRALAADAYADAEDPDEYRAEGVFWVPETAR